MSDDPIPNPTPTPTPKPTETAKADKRTPVATVGRIVFYRAMETEQEENNKRDVAPALVTGTDSENVVNLRVFFDGGKIEYKPNVKFGNDLGQWAWPPRS